MRNIILGIILICLCSLTTLAQVNWSVDAAQFQYSMVVTGVLEVDGILSEDIDDVVGVFVDMECRGVAQVEYVAEKDSYFVFLMVYSNSLDEEGIEFHVYDKSVDDSISLTKVISFVADDFVGTGTKPYTISSRTLEVSANVEDLLFSISTPTYIINEAQNAIEIYLSENEKLESETVEFVLSNGARCYVNGVLHSGTFTLNDFSQNSVTTITVESEDLSISNDWEVTLYVALSHEDIPSLTVESQNKNKVVLNLDVDYTYEVITLDGKIIQKGIVSTTYSTIQLENNYLPKLIKLVSLGSTPFVKVLRVW